MNKQLVSTEVRTFAKVICIAIIIRFITQMTSFFIANDLTYGKIVYNGILVLELTSLLIMLRIFRHVDYCKYFIDFSIGCVIYSLVKVNFLEPYKVSIWEYLSTIIGLIYIALKYVYVSLVKRTN
jgi:hypothetical protein